jgi:predicted phosphodiesterase
VAKDSFKRYVVLSDIHVPYQNRAAIDAICSFMKDYRPDGLILNGDILELDEVSKHSSGSLAQLEGKRIARTFTEGNALLDKLCVAAGKQCTERHFVAGNHEHRLTRWLAAGDNAVFKDDPAMSIPTRLRLKLRGFLWHGEYPEAHVKLGHLVVTHGQFCAKDAARRHLERYQTSVLVGHTHVSGSYHASTFTGQRGAYCAGHLADETADAMQYAPKPKAWITGFATVVVHVPTGDFHVDLHNFVSGVFHVGGKAYGKRKVA